MKIGTLGFPEDQRKKLDKILTLSKSRTLTLVDFNPACLPDLLLVLGESFDACTEVAELPDTYRARLVLVNKQKPSSPDQAHIKLPFISSRVLRTLEAFKPLDQAEKTEAPETPAELEQTLTEAPPSLREKVLPSFVAATLSEPVMATTTLSSLAEDTGSTAQPQLATATAEAKENPFSKYDAQIEEVRRQQAEQDAQPTEDHYAVLVVDDSHPMQQMLAKELQQMDQPVNLDFADDGETALEKADRNHYDFIFLDIMMPGIDGFETCTRLRQIPALKKTPIIMLSSKTSPLDEVKGIMAGSSTYLTKPINHVEFQKVIKRVSRWVSEFKK